MKKFKDESEIFILEFFHAHYLSPNDIVHSFYNNIFFSNRSWGNYYVRIIYNLLLKTSLKYIIRVIELGWGKKHEIIFILSFNYKFIRYFCDVFR